MVPKLRFGGFDDNFISARLSDVCEVKGRIGFRGYAKSDLVGENEGALTLGGKHIDSNDKLNLNDPDYLSWEKYEESPEIKVHTGDIILAQRGTLGQSALIDKEIGKATINPSMVLLKDFKINNVFLHYLLTTSKLKKEVIRKSSSTAVPMISQAEIKKLKIYYPNQTEQEKIANFFRIIDKKIRLLENKLKFYQNFKKYLMQQIFTQKLRFDFDEEWEIVRLKDIVERVTRKNTKLESNLALTISAEHGLIDQEKFFNKIVASKSLKNYYLIKNGEFAYNKSYSNGYPFGAIKRLNDYDMGALSTLYICFKPTNVDSDFLQEYFETTMWYKEIYSIAVEGARNHGLLNINVQDFFNTKHKIPQSIEEQQKIANLFKTINLKILNNNTELNEVIKFKKGLLQQMFV